MSGLDQFFIGTACKYLSAVDATAKSNQHEIGSNKFKEILGDPENGKLYFDATFLRFVEDEDEPDGVVDQVTYYDTRLNQPHRAAELRLYYRKNAVTEKIDEGDFCLIAARPDRKILIAFAPAGSVHERRLRHLFSLDAPVGGWHVEEQVSDTEIDLASGFILDSLGIELPVKQDEVFEKLMHEFKGQFPSTHIFSAYARKTIQIDIDPKTAPDRSLEEWMKHEEMLFRMMERHLVEDRLKQGFETVEDFVGFSLSVQNRRKSRVGHALENHLEAVFWANEVVFQRGAMTEARAKPDFLFPSATKYHDPDFDAQRLRMLAAKSTCKDRWRQILSEASKIKTKHLFTLETAITKHQTDEMVFHKVQLVVPPSVATTYTQEQQAQIISLQQFIEALPE